MGDPSGASALLSVLCISEAYFSYNDPLCSVYWLRVLLLSLQKGILLSKHLCKYSHTSGMAPQIAMSVWQLGPSVHYFVPG